MENYGGGLDEMDIMNQAEVIYDNSCFLSFVCMTYNLKSLGKLRLKFDLFHMCFIGNDELATFFDQNTVGELSQVNGT